MAKRIALAAVLGGVAMFVWGAISHMALGLGSAGIREIPNEEAILGPLRDNIREPGFYFFPGMAQPAGGDAADAEARWKEKIESGPSGILIYKPAQGEAMSPRQLLTELGSNVLCALVAALLLAQAGVAGFAGRVVFVALLGLLSSLAIDVSYWNWYGFPGTYTVGAIVDQVVGFTLTGIVVAAFVKPSS